MDWQSYTALGVVALTLAVFVRQLLRRRKDPSSCGGSCGCAASEKPRPRTGPTVTVSSPRGD